jgi:hypothetical protein
MSAIFHKSRMVRSVRRDPKPQSERDQRHRADAAEPQQGKPGEPLRQRRQPVVGTAQE